MKKSRDNRDFFFWRLLAGMQVRIGIVRIVPIDVHLARVLIEVHVRHVAIRIARTRFLSDFIQIHRQSFAKLSAFGPVLAGSFFMKHLRLRRKTFTKIRQAVS